MKTKARKIVYPESDGKPMGETPLHRRVMNDLIEELDQWFASNPRVYVSGNMMLYYEEGDPRRTCSPDVQVTLDIPKSPERRIYQTWVEGKGPDFVIEVTSRKTARRDRGDKLEIYREVLGVQEYFLFDPFEEYLEPSLQGFRLVRGQYVPIRPVNRRLPSKMTGLHLERNLMELRLFDPKAGKWLLTPREMHETRLRNEAIRAETEDARRQYVAARRFYEEATQQTEEARRQAELELERLRRELDTLRKQSPRGQ
jgi:Uma2 family endonuclease